MRQVLAADANRLQDCDPSNATMIDRTLAAHHRTTTARNRLPKIAIWISSEFVAFRPRRR